MDILKLRNKVKSDYFDYQTLAHALAHRSHVRRDIGQFIKSGHIIRVKKGLYTWSEELRQNPYSKEILSNLIYGPSYLSLEYALAFYGLIPERIHVVTAVTTQRNKSFKTPVGTFEYHHLYSRAYPQGLSWKKWDKIGGFLIASAEKALLDYIAIRVKEWKNEMTCEEFLYEDLRLDQKEFQKMDDLKIENLSSYYRNKAVRHFAQEVVKMRR